MAVMKYKQEQNFFFPMRNEDEPPETCTKRSEEDLETVLAQALDIAAECGRQGKFAQFAGTSEDELLEAALEVCGQL